MFYWISLYRTELFKADTQETNENLRAEMILLFALAQKAYSNTGRWLHTHAYICLITEAHEAWEREMYEKYLSSTWCEFDPNTAYVVCISICIGLSLYGIHMLLFSLYGNHMPLPSYMVIQPIVLGMALLWAAIDSAWSQGPLLWRRSDMTVVVSRNARGRERDSRQRLDNANAPRL